MGKVGPLYLAAVLLVTACTFDYQEGSVEPPERTGVPQVEINGVRMVIVRDNRIELVADRVATYAEERIQEFEGLLFREYGPDGGLRVSGEASGGILYLDSEDIELQGTVRFESLVEEATLESEFLYWENADRVLRSDDDSPVTLTRTDGSRLEGRGLRFDGRRNVVDFSQGVTGVYQTEETP